MTDVYVDRWPAPGSHPYARTDLTKPECDLCGKVHVPPPRPPKALKYSEDQPRDEHGRFGSGGDPPLRDVPGWEQREDGNYHSTEHGGVITPAQYRELQGMQQEHDRIASAPLDPPSPEMRSAVETLNSLIGASQAEAHQEAIEMGRSNPEAGRLSAAIRDWTRTGDASANVREALNARLQGTNVPFDPAQGPTDALQTAQTLYTALQAATPVDQPLYRGLSLSTADLASYQPGAQVDLPISSFSTSEDVAQGFMLAPEAGGRMGRILVQVDPGATGLNVMPFSDIPQEQEIVSGGRFTVSDVAPQRVGFIDYTRITLTQVKALGKSAWALKWIPDGWKPTVDLPTFAELRAGTSSGKVMHGAILKALIGRADAQKVDFFTGDDGQVHPIRDSDGYSDDAAGGGGGRGGGQPAPAAPREVMELGLGRYATDVGGQRVRLDILGTTGDAVEHDHAERALRTVGDLAERYPEVMAATLKSDINPGRGLGIRVMNTAVAESQFGRLPLGTAAFVARNEEGGIFSPDIHVMSESTAWGPSGQGEALTDEQRAAIDEGGVRLFAPSIEGAVAHEFGHMLDYSTSAQPGGGQSLALYGEMMKNGTTVDRSGNRTLASYMSEYGQSSAREAYAEAFSAWTVTNGQTTNPAVQMYAHTFGWRTA